MHLFRDAGPVSSSRNRPIQFSRTEETADWPPSRGLRSLAESVFRVNNLVSHFAASLSSDCFGRPRRFDPLRGGRFLHPSSKASRTFFRPHFRSSRGRLEMPARTGDLIGSAAEAGASFVSTSRRHSGWLWSARPIRFVGGAFYTLGQHRQGLFFVPVSHLLERSGSSNFREIGLKTSPFREGGGI